MNFKEMIDQHIFKIWLEEQEGHSKTGNIWPTDASVEINGEVFGKCLRQIWYRINGFSILPIEPEKIRRFYIGTSMEKQEIEWAKELGALIDSQGEIKFQNPLCPKQTISGRYDILIKDENGNNVIIEYKTVQGYGTYKKIFEEGLVKIEHLLQISIYLYHMGEKVKYGYISYAYTNNWERKDFKVSVDEDGQIYLDNIIQNISVFDIFKRWCALQKYIDNKELPPKDFTPIYTDEDEIFQLYSDGIISKADLKKWKYNEKIISDLQCSWCPYRHHCIFDRSEMEDRNNDGIKVEDKDIMDDIIGEFINIYSKRHLNNNHS